MAGTSNSTSTSFLHTLALKDGEDEGEVFAQVISNAWSADQPDPCLARCTKKLY